MQPDKHTDLAKRYSLAIIILAMTSIYIYWQDHNIEKVLNINSKFELILKTSGILSEKKWSEGQDVRIGDLIDYDRSFNRYFLILEDACKRSDISCLEQQKNFKVNTGIEPKLLRNTIPNTRTFTLPWLRSDFGNKCDILVSRGKASDSYWVKSLGAETLVDQINGNQIYFVRSSQGWRYSLQGPLFNFLLVDMRPFGKGWHFYVNDNILESFLVQTHYDFLKSIESFMAKSLDNWAKQDFEKELFFSDFPEKLLRNNFKTSIPNHFVTLSTSDIESRFIGKAYMATGELYNKEELERAIFSAYSIKYFSPNVAGITTNREIWVSLTPGILMIFSFLFMYHIKRVVWYVGESSTDPWFFLDPKGFFEKIAVILVILSMFFSPTIILFVFFEKFDLSLPSINGLKYWFGLNQSPLAELEYGNSYLSGLGVLGSLVMVLSFYFIAYAIYLLVRSYTSRNR